MAAAQCVILTKIDTATVGEVALSLVVRVGQWASNWLTVEVCGQAISRVNLLERDQVRLWQLLHLICLITAACLDVLTSFRRWGCILRRLRYHWVASTGGDHTQLAHMCRIRMVVHWIRNDHAIWAWHTCFALRWHTAATVASLAVECTVGAVRYRSRIHGTLHHGLRIARLHKVISGCSEINQALLIFLDERLTVAVRLRHCSFLLLSLSGKSMVSLKMR